MRERFMKAHRKFLDRQGRKKAYAYFRKLLRKLINYARNHPPPELVTSRLRKMSDVILKQICEIRDIDVPARSATGNSSKEQVECGFIKI